MTTLKTTLTRRTRDTKRCIPYHVDPAQCYHYASKATVGQTGFGPDGVLQLRESRREWSTPGYHLHTYLCKCSFRRSW